MSLDTLDLSSRNLADVSALAGLTGLRELDLSGNGITELWPLAGLTGLERLNLSDNHIGELWPLADLAGLEVLLLTATGSPTCARFRRWRGWRTWGCREPGRGHRRARAARGAASARPVGQRRRGHLGARRRLGTGLAVPGNPVPDLAPLGRLEQLRWLWLDPATAAGTEALAPPAGAGRNSSGSSSCRSSERREGDGCREMGRDARGDRASTSLHLIE